MEKTISVFLVLSTIAFSGYLKDAQKADKNGNIVKAVELYKKAAEQGNATAQYNLADIYCNGATGVAKNTNKAIEYYNKSGEQGNAEAYFALGYMYQKAEGVEPDLFKAIDYFNKSFELGSNRALINIGWLYNAVDDFTKAFAYYKKACDKGVAMGCLNVGNKYHKGQGVAKDKDKELSFYKKACDLGEKDGCFNYEKIKNQTEPQKSALDMITDKCNDNNSEACYRLAIEYGTGKNVDFDYDNAEKFMKKACSLKHKKACEVWEEIYGS